MTQGYRKVAGDICTKGVDHKPLKLPCPLFGFLSSNNFYNFVGLIAALGAVYFIYSNRDLFGKLLINFLDSF